MDCTQGHTRVVATLGLSAAACALAHVAARSDDGPLDPTVRITINFHPARHHRGLPLLRAVADDREYRSQFETGTGNGRLSAFPGGERWQWETRLFGGADDTAPRSLLRTVRVRYGVPHASHRPRRGRATGPTGRLRRSARAWPRAPCCRRRGNRPRSLLSLHRDRSARTPTSLSFSSGAFASRPSHLTRCSSRRIRYSARTAKPRHALSIRLDAPGDHYLFKDFPSAQTAPVRTTRAALERRPVHPWL